MGDIADFSFLKSIWPFLVFFVLSIVFLHIFRSRGKHHPFYIMLSFFFLLSSILLLLMGGPFAALSVLFFPAVLWGILRGRSG